MASRRSLGMVLTLFLLAVLLSRATAQSDCKSVLVTLSPCLDYMTGNSSTPSSDCCNQLANVIKANATCLCEVINGTAASMGNNFNQTRALELPGACHLQTPSISQCNATATPPPPAPSGSSGTPGTPPGGNASDGFRIKMSLADDQLFSVLLIIMVSFVSVFAATV